ncbi:hypothetical protein A3H85_00475 [Candidatus Daviesbacteria bacterium RIFCSPLOWO2_02_FULL_40_8]|nr:MAG: hypothetical protein A3H85_00475 [Candidatus Daviesbacteria bacterium RIFCSPLOWO2_02_FULL_40_8]
MTHESDATTNNFYAKDAGRRVSGLLRSWNNGVDTPWSELDGVRILDIGSGTADNYVWSPYFARICSVNGAEVTAIDINPQIGSDQRLFVNITTDIVSLVAEGKFKEHPLLKNRKFDIINSTNLVGINRYLGLFDEYDKNCRQKGTWRKFTFCDFEEMLMAECETLLAEGGILDLDDNLFTHHLKYNGKLLKRQNRLIPFTRCNLVFEDFHDIL